MRMMAPDGYPSNYAALIDLLKFGFGIWTLSEMAALVFHAERSTIMGRDSDQHSQRDALLGIYCPAEFRWVRGPSGISKATWLKANNELIKAGVLRSYRRENKNLKHDATEYEVIWPAIARAIDNWKERQSEARGLLPDSLEEDKEA